MFDDQAAVDAAFADLDGLLRVASPPPAKCCRNCGGANFQPGQNDGQIAAFYSVCSDCGCIDEYYHGSELEHHFTTQVGSNYKRIHHWHERISQLFLCESPIPREDFLKIAECLLDGSHAYVNKDVIRGVLRSLNMQLYIEKWLQIIQRLTGIESPKPGAQLLVSLDQAFTELQEPFNRFKAEGRKNFLNYNYVFCRLFQRLGCTQFCMFFPLIKSRPKLRALDDMWEKMVASLGWEVTPLVVVPPFAVKLEEPALALQRLRTQADAAAPVVMRTPPWRTEFRKSDLRLLHELDRQKSLKRRRSAPPAQELQRLGSSLKHPRSASGVTLLRRYR